MSMELTATGKRLMEEAFRREMAAMAEKNPHEIVGEVRVYDARRTLLVSVPVSRGQVAGGAEIQVDTPYGDGQYAEIYLC
jgi:hypothetical protein